MLARHSVSRPDVRQMSASASSVAIRLTALVARSVIADGAGTLLSWIQRTTGFRDARPRLAEEGGDGFGGGYRAGGDGSIN